MAALIVAKINWSRQALLYSSFIYFLIAVPISIQNPRFSLITRNKKRRDSVTSQLRRHYAKPHCVQMNQAASKKSSTAGSLLLNADRLMISDFPTVQHGPSLRSNKENICRIYFTFYVRGSSGQDGTTKGFQVIHLFPGTWQKNRKKW